jgi:hypothetical protein
MNSETMFYAWIAAWIAVAVIVGVLAHSRGRVGFGWFLLSMVISPLFIAPLVFALPRKIAEPGRSIPLFSIFKWLGITILVCGLTFVAYMLLGFFLIIQHGGA